jgi:hypothetical protein
MIKTLGLALAVSAASGAANAALVLQYGTAGSVTSLAPVFADGAVAADNLVAGPGLTVLNYSTFNFSNWDLASTTFDAAVAADDYWRWGFDANQAIALTSFDIRVDRSGTGPDDFEIRAAINGGAESTVFAYDFGGTTAGISFLGVDLTGFNLSAGDSIEFTLAAFNATGTGGTFDLEVHTYPGGTDGISIYGDLAPVPVPAAFILFASGLAGLFGYSRRAAV